METPSLTAAVRRELLAHPEVTEAAHRFGGVVFHLGRRELGHLHGETVADLPLPSQIRDELVATGRLPADAVSPDSDWVSRRVTGPHDVAQVVELFRISYEHAAARAAWDEEDEDRQVAHEDDRRQRAGWRAALASPARLLARRRRRSG